MLAKRNGDTALRPLRLVFPSIRYGDGLCDFRKPLSQ